MLKKFRLICLQKVLFLPLVTAGLLVGPAESQEKNTPDHYLITDSLPFRQQPVDYFGSKTGDRMRRVIDRLETIDVSLGANQTSGYLVSLLKALEIPVQSQLLVYSKTALNPQRVTPSSPRAIYFNDDSYVGWVPGSGTIEVASLDPQKGAIFYTVRQPRKFAESENPSPCGQDTSSASAVDSGRIRRETRCLTCHVSTRTLQIPGLLTGSYLTDQTGKPVSGYSHVDLSTAWINRFGGWYVTGDGSIDHLGNRVRRNQTTKRLFPPAAAGRSNLPVDSDRYPVDTSGLVAHLVFLHQTRVHNLLIRVVQESAFDRPSDAVDQLCRELLFAGEVRPPQRIAVSEFSRQFAGQGDLQRFRQFDLKERLFQNRVSFVVTSGLFDRLDDDVRNKILTGLWDRLHDPLADFTKESRRAAIALMRNEVKRLPDDWR